MPTGRMIEFRDSSGDGRRFAFIPSFTAENRKRAGLDAPDITRALGLREYDWMRCDTAGRIAWLMSRCGAEPVRITVTRREQ